MTDVAGFASCRFRALVIIAAFSGLRWASWPRYAVATWTPSGVVRVPRTPMDPGAELARLGTRVDGVRHGLEQTEQITRELLRSG